MNTFVSLDGDDVGRLVGKASLSNDVEGLRRIAQAIDAGERILRSWALSAGGSVVSAGGDEARLEIPADHLHELLAIRSQYQSQVGFTVSVGVGLQISQADKALVYSKLAGKDRVTFWSPEVEDAVREAFEDQRSKTEKDKIGEEYFGKAEDLSDYLEKANKVAMHPDAFQGAHKERPAPPARDQGDHSAGQAAADVAATQQPPELTHAASDFEQQFHEEASKQAAVDQADQAAQQDTAAQVKQQVAQTLAQVRQLAPQLEALSQAAPDVYQAVGAMAQAMVALARELATQGPPGAPGEVAKSEQHTRPEPARSLDADRLGPNAVHVDPETTPSDGQVRQTLGKKTRKKALGKGALPAARHKLVLPVGSQIDAANQGTRDVGRVKVQHGTGKEGWIHARAGQVMSQDEGHPISARNPRGT